jgi:transposase-like protein
VPVLAIADGALGLWADLRKVYAETREQKIANALDRFPKRLQPSANAMLHEIMRSPSRNEALEEIGRFSEEFEVRYSKAVETMLKDQDPLPCKACRTLPCKACRTLPCKARRTLPCKARRTLCTFFDFPAQHWIHLRTSNPIESAFSTVEARARKPRGAGSRTAGCALAFKLLDAAKGRWRRIHAPALVRAGKEFPDGDHEAFRDGYWPGDDNKDAEPVESASAAYAAHAS